MTEMTQEEKIIEAAIECIETFGIANTTTRKIASQAGTNVAAINYYFRSKDELIAKALEQTLEHMNEDMLAILNDEQRSFDAVLDGWIRYMVEGMERYPGIFMAHMYPLVVDKELDVPVVVAFRELIDLLLKRAWRAYPDTNVDHLQRAIQTLISALLFDILAPGFHKDASAHSVDLQVESYLVAFRRVAGID